MMISKAEYSEAFDDKGGRGGPYRAPEGRQGNPPPRRRPPQGGRPQVPPQSAMRRPGAPQGRPTPKPAPHRGMPPQGRPAPGRRPAAPPTRGRVQRQPGTPPPRRPSRYEPDRNYDDYDDFDDFDDFDEFDDDYDQKKRKNKIVIILLDVLIAGLLIAAAVLFIYPRWINKQQKDMRDDILDKLKEADGGVVNVRIGKEEMKVPGERYEEGFGPQGEGNEYMQDEAKVDEDGMVNISIIGRLVIAKIGCDAPIAADSDRWSLRFSVGHYAPSPLFNEDGQAIIFGHRFLDKGRDFNRLDEIEVGDTFYVDYALDQTRYIYKVDDFKIIPAGDLRTAVDQQFDEQRCMLVTCHPLNYGAANQRILVYGKLEKTEDISK